MNTDYVRESTIKYIGPRMKSPTLSNAQMTCTFLRKLVRDENKEHFLALYLNGAHEAISYSVVSIGGANSTQIHPREIFAPALIAGAIAIIVAHNHPTGHTDPSAEDRRVTNRLKECGETLGIKLLDHIVFSDTSNYSFADHGEV